METRAGGVFSINPNATELAGIMYAAGPTPGQPADTALFTNLTFIARLDFYRDEIEEIRAPAPPPSSCGMGIELALLLPVLAGLRFRGRFARTH